MTPTAVTPAARTKRSGGSATKRPSSPHPSTPRTAHRAPRGGATAPSAPRRVSGPARRATTPARRTAAPARAKTRTTRATGTTKTTGATRTTRAAATPRTRQAPAPALPIHIRAISFARALPEHSLLDRLIRGRLWIPLLGVLLIGIVASQVEILKQGASLGHGVVRAAQLQSENERLAGAVSQMSDVQRIEQKAAGMGLTMPAAYLPVFVSGGGRNELRQALANIHKPDPSAFEARLAALAAHRAAEVQSSSGA